MKTIELTRLFRCFGLVVETSDLAELLNCRDYLERCSATEEGAGVTHSTASCNRSRYAAVLSLFLNEGQDPAGGGGAGRRVKHGLRIYPVNSVNVGGNNKVAS